MKHFSDPDLEQKSVEIENRVKRILATSDESIRIELNMTVPEAESILSQLLGNNISFAAEFFNECLSDLKYIKSRCPQNDSNLQELTNGVSMWVVNILKLGIQYPFSLSRFDDFHSQMDGNEMFRIRQNLEEAYFLLKRVSRELVLNDKRILAIADQLAVLSYLRMRFKS